LLASQDVKEGHRICRVRTRLSKSTALVAARPNIELLRPSRINILLHRPSSTRAQAFQPRTQRALACRYTLQPLSLPPTQLHDLVLESLLALVPCPLDRPASRLIATRHPTGDACFGWVAPYVSVDSREERIVRVFEGGRGEDLGQLVGQLLLVEVAEEKEGQGFLVDGPVCIAYGAFDCGVQGLDVYTGGARRVGLLGEVGLEGREAGQGARRERRRGGDVHVIGAYGACHDGGGSAPWWRSMRRDVRVARSSRVGQMRVRAVEKAEGGGRATPGSARRFKSASGVARVCNDGPR